MGHGPPNIWRARALALIAAALAAPPRTKLVDLCAMRKHGVLSLRMPEAGRRWVRNWFRIRAEWMDRVQAELTPWLALPPMSRGTPRQMGWAAVQTLHRAGEPAWRLGALTRAEWPELVVAPAQRRKRTG